MFSERVIKELEQGSNDKTSEVGKVSYFGNVHHDWDYLMSLAEQTGDWELYDFARRMKEEEEKWEPKIPQW